MKNLNGGVFVISISGLFLFKYILVIFFGATILNITYISYELWWGEYERLDFMLNLWVLASAAMLLIPLGMYLAIIIFRSSEKESKQIYYLKQIKISSSDTKSTIYIFTASLLILGAIVLYFYINAIEIIPLIQALSGADDFELALLRSNATNAYTGKLYRVELFTQTIPFFFMIYLFWLRKHSKKWNLLFLVVFLFTLFTHLMTLQKGPAIYLVLAMFAAIIYTQKAVSVKKVLKYAVSLVFCIFAIYFLFKGMNIEDYTASIKAITHRIFIGQVSPFYWYQVFVEQNGLLYGRSFPNPMGIFPFEYVPLTIEVSYFARPHLAKLGIVGSMPTVFFGDWMANFGFFAALFSMVLIGFITKAMDIILLRRIYRNDAIVYPTLYIFLAVYISKYVGTSFVAMVLDEKILAIIIITFIIAVLRGESLHLKKVS